MDQFEKTALSRARAALNLLGESSSATAGAIEFLKLGAAQAITDGDLLVARGLVAGLTRAGPILEKASVGAGSLSDPNWAAGLSPYATLASDFVESTRMFSPFDQIFPFTRRVPLRGRVACATTGATGSVVEPGAPVPVSVLAIAGQTLALHKAVAMVVTTAELLRMGSPAGLEMLRRELGGALGTTVTKAFIDYVSVGAPVVLSTGATAAAVCDDIAALIGQIALGASSTLFLVLSAKHCASLAFKRDTAGALAFPSMGPLGGSIQGVRVLAADSLTQLVAGSPTIARDTAVMIDSDGIVANDLAVTIDGSGSASLQLLTAPTNQSTLVGSPQTPVATNLTSLFQTHSAALRATRYFGCERIRTSVAVLSGVSW